ncbi:hypothetical protein [Pseudarthrobacter sp. N5]|uniref:hypothetical protein n=1 Tax=Pseudarthrobacter sp. N5 TaxID=3418416 RepID=UPI003CF9A7B2
MSEAAEELHQNAYRAGHLQGWRDALASRGVAARSGTPQPVGAAEPAPLRAEETLPARAAWKEGSVASAATDHDAATDYGATTNHGDHPWLPVAGPVRLPAPQPAPPAAARPVPAQAGILPRSFPPQLPPPTPAELEAEQQAHRVKRDRQNINVTLYIASLLLVAAGALFIGTNLPVILRFAGVCAITTLFYVAGFVLHARAPRLRPAAVAFAGTGLALIPVTGLAMFNFALHNGPVAWLVTSLVGTAAYLLAAVRLQSKVLAYLSLTFVISTAWSGVTVLGGALVWYFVVMIGVAVLLTALALMSPRWMPPVYVKPLMDLHPFVVPMVAVAVTLVPLLLDKGEYALVMAMCGFYFSLMVFLPAGRYRLLNFLAARLALTVAAAVGIWHFTDRGSYALLVAAVLLAGQSVWVAITTERLEAWLPPASHTPPNNSDASGASGEPGRWTVDALVTFGVQLLATVTLVVAVQLRGAFSIGALDQLPEVPLWVPVLLALATGMVLAVKLGGAAEWAPAAGLALAGLLGERLGYWPLAGMLALAAAFWTVRSIPSGGPLRQQFVLAARVAVTLAVPVTVAAAWGTGWPQQAPILLALALALVCQQMVTASLLLAGMRSLAPNISLAVLAAGGLLTVSVLPFSDTTPGESLAAVGLMVQLPTALGIGWLLLPRSAESAMWQPSVPEALPIVVALAAVPLAFGSVSQLMGNVALLLVAVYLAATALRLPGRQHRWAYWWLARVGATALVLTAFRQLRDDAGPVVLGNENLLPSTVLVTALAVQLVLPLMAVLRGRAPRLVMADVAAVLGLQLAATGSITAANAEWQNTFAIAVAAVCATVAGYVLRDKTWTAAVAPAALALLLAFSDGELLDVELLLGIFAVFSAVMVVAVRQRVAKGWYFVAARALMAALAVVLSYDISASATAVSVTFALVLAAQHLIRWLMRRRLQEVPFQQAAVWITLAGQMLLPLGYLWQSRFPQDLQADEGGRWVVLLELVLLLVSAVAASRFFAARGAVYLAVYAALFGVVALGPLLSFGPGESGSVFLAAPVLSDDGVPLVLLAMSLVAATAGILLRHRSVRLRNTPPATVEQWLWLAAAASFAVAGFVMSASASDWIAAAAVLVFAAVCFTASHVEGWPALYPLAATSVLVGATLVAVEVFQDVPGVWGDYLPTLAGCGVAAAGLYAVRLTRSGPLLNDPLRRWSLAGAGELGFAFAAVSGLWHHATSGSGAALVALTAAIGYIEAPAKVRRVTAELGALVITVAVQRAVLFVDDGLFVHDGQRFSSWPYAAGPDPFWVTQWYVVLAALLALLRFGSGHALPGRILMSVGAGLLSLSGLGIIFAGNGSQQLWVLSLLAVLLVVGLGLGERMFVWWGAAGVVVCIMWAMRQYTFALLALIAVGLIAFAVWRLNRSKPDEAPVEVQPTVQPEEPSRRP